MSASSLKTERNTPEMDSRIRMAFEAWIGAETKDRYDTDFEHGQWWVTGAQWSVVDAEGDGSVDGFDFEQVTQGDRS